MNFRGIAELVTLLFSKIFVRALILLALLIFTSSFLPWTRGLYNEIFPQPELRISQFAPVIDGQIGTDWWYQRVSVVENRGNSAANQVYVSASVPSGRISRFSVFADYPYEVHPSSDTSRGYLLITLDKLAPGARVIVYLWGSQNASSESARISFAAVHETGSALHTTELSSSEQIQNIVDEVLISFKLSWDFIVNNEKIRSLVEWGEGDFFILPAVPYYLLLAVLAIAVFLWVFSEPIKTAITYGLLVAGVYWLTVHNVYLYPTFLVGASLIIMFTLILINRPLRETIRRSIKRDQDVNIEQSSRTIHLNERIQWALALSTIVLLIGIGFQIIDAPLIYQATGYILIWYVTTMVSLALI